MLLAERRSAVQARTVAINQLHRLVVTLPAELREQLSGLSSVDAGQDARTAPSLSDEIGAVLRRIAQRAESLQREISEIFSSLGRIVRELAPELLAQCGVGIICAAQLVVSSGDAKRMPQRRGICRARRHQPRRCLERQPAAPPPQPRRRPPTQLGAARDHTPTCLPRPRDYRHYERLLASGKTAPRSQTLRQTRPRPPTLPPTPPNTLDNIEASSPRGSAHAVREPRGRSRAAGEADAGRQRDRPQPGRERAGAVAQRAERGGASAPMQ